MKKVDDAANQAIAISEAVERSKKRNNVEWTPGLDRIGIVELMNKIGQEDLNQALDWMKTPAGSGALRPSISLISSFNVTFEEPSKPPLTGFKRFACHAGDTFILKEIRSTARNPLIFRFDFGLNVQRNMRRHSTGPGLSMSFKTAEFTMSQIKDDMTDAISFFEEVIYAHDTFVRSVRKTEDMYEDDNAGTW